MVDYYQVLGVKHTASSKEIKAAYKRLARLQHPDLNGGSAKAAQAFVQLSHARDILIDPRSRAEYDAQRHAAAPGPGAYAAVLKPTGENSLRRVRSDIRIRQNLENFQIAQRQEARALRQAVFPIVAFLFAAFCVALIRPRIWRYSGWTGRAVNLPLLGKALSGRRALFLIGLAAIGFGLLGTLVGMSLSDLLSIAMPRFFDQSIRLELLLYPWVMVLFLNACHSVSQRLDI